MSDTLEMHDTAAFGRRLLEDETLEVSPKTVSM